MLIGVDLVVRPHGRRQARYGVFTNSDALARKLMALDGRKFNQDCLAALLDVLNAQGSYVRETAEKEFTRVVDTKDAVLSVTRSVIRTKSKR